MPRMVSKDGPLRAPRDTSEAFMGKGVDPVRVLHNEMLKSAKHRERIGQPMRKRKTRRSKR